MSQEASLQEWKELYEAAIKIKSMQPWNYLWDMDLITILLPEYEEPFYCSIMGRNGECFAIGIYPGFDAIHDFYRMARSTDIPPEQLIRYQNCLMCYFGDRNELTAKERQIIKELGLKFRGRNEWIFFRSFKAGYFPYMPDREEVHQLTQVFQQLFMALRAFIEKEIEVDFEQGNTLFRQYDKEKDLWLTFEMPNLIPPKQYMVPILQNDILVARMNKQKRNKNEIELDIAYLNSCIRDKDFERPIIPRLLILADRGSGMLLDQKLLTPEDDETQDVFNYFINYIGQMGKPKAIYVRDEYFASLLSDFCEKTNIPIKIQGRLWAIDTFVRAFAEQGF